MKKAKKILKYLFGIGAGCILAGAVVGGIVSCSNGNTTTSQQSTPHPTVKPTTSSSTKSTDKATKSEAKDTTPTKQSTPPTNTTTAYELTNRYDNSTIAYKDPQNATNKATDLILASTSSDNYSTLINEPNNVIISVLGKPEAVINVKNDTNSKTAPNINLNLNPNSDLYKECLAHTNNATDLKSLSNLITFSTTKSSTDTFNMSNLSVGSKKYMDSWTFSLIGFQAMLLYSGDIALGVGAENNGLYVITPHAESLNTFWNNIHTPNPTTTFTTSNFLLFKNGTQVPFNLTIDLLPLIQYSQAHPTLTFNTTPTVNTKEGTVTITTPKSDSWELSGIPKSDMSICGYQNTWYANTLNNFPSFPTTSIVLPYNATTLEVPSIPYMYFDNGMIIVGTTAPSPIPALIQQKLNTLQAEVSQLNQYEQTIQTLESTNKNDQSIIQQLGTYLNQASQQLQADEEAQTAATKTLTQANTQIQKDEQTIQNLQNELSSASNLISTLKQLATAQEPSSVTYMVGINGIKYPLDNATLYQLDAYSSSYYLNFPNDNYGAISANLYDGSITANTKNPQPVPDWTRGMNGSSTYALAELSVGTYTLAYQITLNDITSKITYVPFTITYAR